MSTYLSDHFSLEEFTLSGIAARNGIDNSPPQELIPALKHTAQEMEIVRGVLGGYPIHLDSAYRCILLNRALKSADTSQHVRGEAVDFICPAAGTPLQLARALISNRALVNWDQLILEHDWIHISFCANPSAIPRNSVLSLLSNGKYAHGLTDVNGRPL